MQPGKQVTAHDILKLHREEPFAAQPEPYTPRIPVDVVRDSSHDFLVPDPEAATEQVKERQADILHELSCAEAEIQHALGKISSLPGLADLDVDRAVGELAAKLSEVASLKDLAQCGSPAAILTMPINVAELVGNISSAVSVAAGNVTLEKGVLMAEKMDAYTAERIQAMTIGNMYDSFGAAEFLHMSAEQHAAVDARIERHVEQSLSTSKQAEKQIESIASENGRGHLLDAWREEQQRLEEEGKNADTPVEKARNAYLRSSNNVAGAAAAGASPEELEERRRQMEEDRRAYALALRNEAAQKAKEMGLSGQEAEEYVDRYEQQGLADADERVERQRDAVAEAAKAEAMQRAQAAGMSAEQAREQGDAAYAAAREEMAAGDAAVSDEAAFSRLNEDVANEPSVPAEAAEPDSPAQADPDVPAPEAEAEEAALPEPTAENVRASRFGGPPMTTATSSLPPTSEEEKTEERSVQLSRFAVTDISEEELGQCTPNAPANCNQNRQREV